MDIKLKNKHSLEKWIIILVIFVPALFIVASYPYFKKQAQREQSFQERDIETAISGLITCNYALYIDALEREQNEKINPITIFYPYLDMKSQTEVTEEDNYSDSEQINEEDFYYYKENFTEHFYNAYHNWERELSNIGSSWEYEVWNEKGERVFANTEKILNDILKDKKKTLSECYFSVQYDEYGKGNVIDANGIEIEKAQNILFHEGDPVETNDTAYAYSKEFSFQNPKGYTFIYSITSEGVNTYKEEQKMIGYYNDGAVPRYVAIILIFISLAAFILPLIKKWQIGKEKIFFIPLEAAFFIFCMAFGLIVSGSVDLVVAGNNLGVKQWFYDIGWNFPDEFIYMITMVIHIVIWSVLFAILYWSATCIQPVFSMGLKRYLKERCLTYYIMHAIGRKINKSRGWFKKIYAAFINIDLSEKSNSIILRIVIVNFIIAAIISSFWFFGMIGLVIYSIVLFFILRKYYIDLQIKYQQLLRATNEIAEGNLDVMITEDLGIFEPFKGEIQKIQSGFKMAVEEEVKSQQMKTDLITNVSHDLKTPLTAIITYVNLLKDENLTKEQQRTYIDILERKSLRLKVLIEDLFEISKATSRNVSLNLIDVDIVSLLKEVRLELLEKIEASGIEFRYNLPNEKVILSLDSQKTYRVFENLLVNITKYAMPNTRAYVSLENSIEEVKISMKNVSQAELNVKPEELTERFVRGDTSRNTEGSGLGLAIAKSFVELQGGTMNLEVEADLFKVTIVFPHKYEMYEKPKEVSEIKLEMTDIAKIKKASE